MKKRMKWGVQEEIVRDKDKLHLVTFTSHDKIAAETQANVRGGKMVRVAVYA